MYQYFCYSDPSTIVPLPRQHFERPSSIFKYAGEECVPETQGTLDLSTLLRQCLKHVECLLGSKYLNNHNVLYALRVTNLKQDLFMSSCINQPNKKKVVKKYLIHIVNSLGWAPDGLQCQCA